MKEHGYFQLERHQQCIVIRCFGPWNVETAHRLSDELRVMAEPLIAQPWCAITDLTEWELAGPEIWEPSSTLHRWLNDNNLMNMAFVTKQNIHRVLLNREIKPNIPTVKSQFFEQYSCAQEWLNGEGFLVDESWVQHTSTSR